MLGKIQFSYNGFTLNDDSTASWAALQKVSGIHDVALRHTRRELTGAHGIQDYDTFAGARTITFEGILISDTEENMADLIEEFKQAFAIEGNPTPTNTGERALNWQDVGEVAKTIDCKIDRGPQITESMYGTLFRTFFVALIADDPRILSQSEHTTDINLGWLTGGFVFPETFPIIPSDSYANSYTASVLGNFEARPTFTITCPAGYTITDPRIDNLTMDTHVEFSGLTMEVGDILTITPGSATFYDASTGTTVDATGYLSATSTAVYLDIGDNEIIFTDTWSYPASPYYTYLTGSWNYITASISWQDSWI